MTNIKDIIAAGERRRREERRCAESGGHHRDRETTVNGESAWKCRCGFAAPKTARVWEDD